MNYDDSLGYYIGEYIYWNYLPTLNISMLKTRTVIEVSTEDKQQFDKLEAALCATYKFNGGDGNSTQAFETSRNFYHSIRGKYLPKVLKCIMYPFVVLDIDKFKKALSDYLWDTDLCEYSVDLNDIKLDNIMHKQDKDVYDVIYLTLD